MTDYHQSGKIGVGGNPGWGFGVTLNQGCRCFEGPERGPKIAAVDVLTLRLNCEQGTLELLVNGKGDPNLCIDGVEMPVRAGLALTGHSAVSVFFPRPSG